MREGKFKKSTVWRSEPQPPIVSVYQPHQQKTAVGTPIGSLQYKVMSPGLSTATQTFQRAADTILRPVRNCTSNFIDDLLVHSTHDKTHLEQLDRLFSILNEHGLRINIRKSHFCKDSVSFLGNQVSVTSVLPQAERTSTPAQMVMERFSTRRTRPRKASSRSTVFQAPSRARC